MLKTLKRVGEIKIFNMKSLFRNYCPPMTKEEIETIKQVNKLFRKIGESYKVLKSKSWGQFTNLGRFYVINIERNQVIYSDLKNSNDIWHYFQMLNTVND